MVKTKGLVVLTEGTPWKCILKFAMPLFLGSLLQQFYYTADTMIVGLLIGQEALSGVGTCAVLTNLLIAFSTGFSAGAGIVSAACFGAKKENEITRNAYASTVSLFFMGILISICSMIWCTPLLRYAVSVPESLMPYSGLYFRICAIGFLFQFLYNGTAALLRSIGDSAASLYFLMMSAVLNIFLDYAMIQWTDMGVAGAAWATVISQILACIISFVYMYHKYPVFRFMNRGIKISTDDVLAIVKLGFPMALQSMAGTVFNLMIQRLVNTFGEAMIASYTVVSRMEGYMHLPTSTLYQALPTYTAQNIGAGKKKEYGLAYVIQLSWQCFQHSVFQWLHLSLLRR